MEIKAHAPASSNDRPVHTHWHVAAITHWQETEGEDGRRRWTLLEPADRFAVQEFQVTSNGGGKQVLLILVSTDGIGDDPMGTFPLLRDAFDSVAEELGAEARKACLATKGGT